MSELFSSFVESDWISKENSEAGIFSSYSASSAFSVTLSEAIGSDESMKKSL